MSTYTENYDLVKAGDEECYDVAVFNENWDTLDTELAATAAEVEGVSDKIGSPDDMGSETVFGKLNNNGSFIKSIQTVIFDVKTGSETTKNLSTPVNSDKCIVLMDYLYSYYEMSTRISYTLNDSSISMTATHSNSGFGICVQFQIIEFY